MQKMNTAPARNSMRAASKPAKVSVPAHAAKKTVTEACGHGKSVKGFSGGGVKAGKI